MDYKVSYNIGVLQTLEEIKDYIITDFKTETSVQRIIADIMGKISTLEIFSESCI